MVIVAGAAQTPFNRRKDNSSFRDWAAEAFDAALDMSGMDTADIDLLVVASESDFFTLQLNPASVLGTDFGLDHAATMRVEGGGASGQLAVHAGVHAILSGQAARVAIVGVDPSASHLSGDAIRNLYGYSFDAWSDGMTGVTATALYALSWQIFADDNGLDATHLAAVTIQNRANAMKNDKAHLGRAHTTEEIEQSPAIASPYRRLHCSPLSDGAAALILCGPGAAPMSRRTAPRICGTGAATDAVHLGARPQKGRFEAKTVSMKRACKQSGIRPQDIGLAEVYDSYAGAQLQALDGLGISDDVGRELRDGRFAPDGSLPVNLSGGMMGLGAPVGAIGVGQTANCALFLEGRNESGLQPETPPAYALADTHGGICTTAAVTLLAQGDAK
ncbi:thiolase family protein [Hoeflea prorocentri]|uniref:Thiolase family protein n=1 Tax=Hoeflea prorocentri TaxID=1922333 RepID=A0A9X3UFT4_9HYPH|nr:thiolase family protein [Hoeflea prorocentri]MCY6379809.1 thiolase family protein [Hoeflea prorocentri]MDA5397609.1 thiolase family protein [Hoeflea prorocentri]